jgi:hypothetical protein
MPKIHEELIVIRLSKLVKNTEQLESPMVSDDVLDALASVADELINDKSIVIEVERT